MRVNRLWLAATVLTGCFYTDPINQRPSIAIHQLHPGDPIARGQQLVDFSAVTNDPDGDSVKLSWRAYACNGTACDAKEFQSGTDTVFELIQVPYANAANESFDTLEIRLEGQDVLGATAKPSQTLDIHLQDEAPQIAMRTDPRPAVVNAPFDVFAKITDADDLVFGPDSKYPPVIWTLAAPATTQTVELTPLTVGGSDPTQLQLGRTFTPGGIGDWTVEVTATDPQQVATTRDLVVHVGPDQLPCVAQWAPAATTDPGTTLPLTDPTLFEVLVVSDDLDPYPSVPNDPVLGTTAFHWSIVPPGGARQQLASVTGNAVALDPDSYTPGDIVELRVEIDDRNHRAVNCPDGDLTCSLTPDPSCNQRLTWRAEVR